MRVTGLGELATGDRVNLERAMRADTRLGGHFVLGHVDAVGHDRRRAARRRVHLGARSGFRRQLAPQFVPKGSVAVDGISLTVAGARRGLLRRADHSAHVDAHEPAAARTPAMRVNLECDIIGKYVARAMR